ncbi:MAG TPA: Gfo/Idh/MocA family oxidoreductase [Bacteroidota bacterium]|nr:Gfo/Idh/MocA family oxidoreductase [Bacteroidota bacterium]
MSKKIRIAIAGVANHGRTILNAIRDSSMFEVKACFDINADANAAAAAETGARAASSFDDLVRDPQIDAVALVTPNHLHFDQIKQSLALGRHVFVEKPMTHTMAEARQIAALASDSPLVVMVGHNTRRRNIFRSAKKMIESGRLGLIAAVEANLSRPVGLTSDLPAWKADPEKCPLLPMTQLGIHFVDVVKFLFSPVKHVYASASNIAMTHGVLDVSTAILRTAENFPITLTSYYVTPDTYFFRIYGTKAILHCRALSYEIESIEIGAQEIVEWESFPDEGPESYVFQMREFGECIQNGSRPETGVEEGLHAVAVVEAMMQSVRTGAAVDL